jgi:hypothetical protein
MVVKKIVVKEKVNYRSLVYIVTSLLNIKTGRDLTYIQVYKIYFNEITIKYGNPGKYLFVKMWLHEHGLTNIQDTLIARILVYVRENLCTLKANKSDIHKLDGGKIAEKAKALSNVNDTKIRHLFLPNRMKSSWPL